MSAASRASFPGCSAFRLPRSALHSAHGPRPRHLGNRSAAGRAGPHTRARAGRGHPRQPRRLPVRRHHRPGSRATRAPAVRHGAGALRPGLRSAHALDRAGGAGRRARVPRDPGARGGPVGRPRQAAGDPVPRRPRRPHGRGRAGRGGADRPRPQRDRLRPPPAPQPVFHARRGHRDRGALHHRLDALRRPLDRGAARQGAVPLSPLSRERRHSVRRLRGETEQLHAGRRRRASAASRPPAAGLQRALQPRRPRPPVRPGVRALRREGRHRRGDAQRADRHPPGHDLHAARPRAVLHLSAAFRGAGAARGAAPSQEIQGREGDAELLRGHAGRRSTARAGVLRRLRPLAAGAGAMVVRLQLHRRATGCHGHLRPQRGHAARARSRRVQDDPGGEPAGRDGESGGGGAGRDHHRGERAGPGRRRSALHDAAVAPG